MNRGLVLDPTRWLAREESSQKSEPVASAVGAVNDSGSIKCLAEAGIVSVRRNKRE